MNKNLGIIDTEKQQKLDHFDKAETQRNQAIQYQRDELNGCVWAHNKDQIHIANIEHQLGNPLHYLDLEKLIRKLPNGQNYVFFDWADSPFPDMRSKPFKSVYYVAPNQPPKYISVYGKTVLPEWSVMKVEEEYVPDLTIRHFDRKDMPRKEWKGWKRGYEAIDPTQPSPWKYKLAKTTGEDPNNPQARGWRTVISRIVGELLATPSEVEKVFTAAERQSWQNHMGRRNDKLRY